MLKKIKIERFKSIESAELNLDKLNFFIGTNSSGKSNFFDALRVLQGIGYGLTVSEIFHGKAKTASNIEWDGIRGASEGAVFRSNEGKRGRPKEPKATTTFKFELEYEYEQTTYHYKIQLEPIKGLVHEESFSFASDRGERKVFETIKSGENSFKAKVYSSERGRPINTSFNPMIPVLHQITEMKRSDVPDENLRAIQQFVVMMGDSQKLDLDPKVLREYSKQFQAMRIGERGENFAALVKTILKDSKKESAYNGWLKKLTPTDIDEVKIERGALGEPIFGVVEGRNTNLAPILSDGTLRFAALTAALFQESAPNILLLEEVDNGIHPTRLRLLVELIIQQAKKGSAQIFITTHSPILLTWLPEKMYTTVFHFQRHENGASLIRPITLIPHFNKVLSKQPFGELFAEGWIENSL